MFNQNMVFFTEWVVYEHSSEEIRHFFYPEKLQSKVRAHEVRCEIIIAFRHCSPKIMNIGSNFLSCRRSNSGHDVEYTH